MVITRPRCHWGVGYTLAPGFWVVAALVLWAPSVAHAYGFDADEAAFDRQYQSRKIELQGVVTDASGVAISGAKVRVIDFASSAGRLGSATLTRDDGSFQLRQLDRRSALLEIEKPGYYREVLPVELQQPRSVVTHQAGIIALTPRVSGRVRLIFGGDVMMGRRFESEGLIRMNSRAADARRLYDYVRDLLHSDDYTVVNLETVLTDDLSTPHPSKGIVFHSHPDTAPALRHAGIEAVSLANNHAYDYLDRGVKRTLATLAQRAPDLHFFGAGINEAQSMASRQRLRVNGVDVSLQGFNIVESYLRPRLFAADPAKPGVLSPHNATTAGIVRKVLVALGLEKWAGNQARFLSQEAGRIAVPYIHGGVEFSAVPSNTLSDLVKAAVDNGASMVVAAHPHAAQGVALYRAKYILPSLGNFVFDQPYLPSKASYLAIADIDGSSARVERLQLVPIHIQDYIPKLVAGTHLQRAGRYYAHLSSLIRGADGLTGAIVVASQHRLEVHADPRQLPLPKDTVVTDSVPIHGFASAPWTLPDSQAESMIAQIRAAAPVQVQIGQEVMAYGGFEDMGIDQKPHGNDVWVTQPQVYLQNSVVRSGVGAAVLLRNATDVEPAELRMRTSARPALPLIVSVTGGSTISLVGHVKGRNSGEFRLRVVFYRDSTKLQKHRIDSISDEIMVRTPGSYDWTFFHHTVVVPPGADGVRATYIAMPPATGEGNTFLDDLGIVQWQDSAAQAQSVHALQTPNNYTHLRFTARDPLIRVVRFSVTARRFR